MTEGLSAVPLLALRNLAAARSRFVTCILAVGFATFLMCFQGSLFVGFLRSAGRLITTTGADAWIVQRGVPCFDFTAPLDEDIADHARGVEGVESATRLAVGFASWACEDGSRRTVALVGADENVGNGFPLPRLDGARVPDGVVIDESAGTLLRVDRLPASVEVNGRAARVVATCRGFGTFLGSPHAFTHHEEARTWLGLPRGTTSLIALRFRKGSDERRSLAALRARFHELDVLDTARFSRSSGAYWMLQTGAGGAIGLAGLLGFLVGGLVVSQMLYAMTIEHLEEFATLRAMGAQPAFIRAVVALQSAACCVLGTGLGLAGSALGVPLARATVVSWVETPGWLVASVWIASAVMCLLGSLGAVRLAISADPARVFRA